MTAQEQAFKFIGIQAKNNVLKKERFTKGEKVAHQP